MLPNARSHSDHSGPLVSGKEFRLWRNDAEIPPSEPRNSGHQMSGRYFFVYEAGLERVVHNLLSCEKCCDGLLSRI